jgi:RNA polymerase sigma-70 factor (ECF subfamily)
MDNDQLERLRGGDEAEFHRFFMEHHRRIFALAMRLGGEEAAAEITQDVFVQAWRGLAGFRGDAALSTWLHGITVNVARRRWRGELRRRNRELEYGAGASQRVNTSPRPGVAIDLEAALRELPPRMRAAVVLTCIEGYTCAEAARMMSITEGAVKAHVHRGRLQLRERLDQ